MPSDLAPAAAPSINSVVATPTVGMPRASRSAMSCVQHEMQDPQSDNPSTTRSTSAAICCRSGNGPASGDGAVPRDLAQPIELFIEARLRPARILKGAVVLGADYQERIARRRVLDVAERLQRSGKALCQALGVARFLVDDPLQTIPGEHGHRRLARLQTALDRQRLPARPFFVLGKTIGEFAGVAEGGAVALLRPAAADIADHQLQGSADCGIGA